MSVDIETTLVTARRAFTSGRTKPIEFRVSQLKALNRCLEENRELWIEALRKDLDKPRLEAILTEVGWSQMGIKEQLLLIEDNVKPRPVFKSLLLLEEAFTVSEPFGTVLIIGPWNYPLQLVLLPLIGAIAAGNCAIIKPSEVSENTADAIAKLLPKYLDNERYHVVTGGPDITHQLLNEKFDYIFFTGSTCVGRVVAQAAAKHLTPVTLELGGKSPVYIDDSVKDLEIVCKRLLFGKLLNTGQTCVAPDYLLCSTRVQQKLVDCFRKELKEEFGLNPKESKDLGRIINDSHFMRITKMIESSGKVAIGGDSDPEQRYIAPTILTDVSPDDPVMQEEIFGPILPIITVSSAEAAIDFIRKRDKPLALYLFTNDKKVTEKFLKNTSSGSLCVNDTLLQVTVFELPFGGVGASGMGRYHGKASFDTFSNQKSVVIRSNGNFVSNYMESKIRFPPMDERKAAMSENFWINQYYYLHPHHWRNLGKYAIILLITSILIYTLFK